MFLDMRAPDSESAVKLFRYLLADPREFAEATLRHCTAIAAILPAPKPFEQVHRPRRVVERGCHARCGRQRGSARATKCKKKFGGKVSLTSSSLARAQMGEGARCECG